MNTCMTVKGRIVIPSEIRRKFGMRKGTRVLMDVDERTRQIILTPITRERIRRLHGKYKGKGLLKALMAGKLRRSKSADR